MTYHSYEPAKGHGLKHDPFNSIIAPRPIGWISTRSLEGTPNLAPYSFFNAFNYRPPIIGFASIGWKDSVRNASQTREFGWNLVSFELADAMNVSSVEFPSEVDEFAAANLDVTPGDLIAAPLVAASPVRFECKVCDIVQLNTAQGTKIDTWLTLGEVVKVHIADRHIVNGMYDTASTTPIMRGGGPSDYFKLGADAKFEMRRPKTS